MLAIHRRLMARLREPEAVHSVPGSLPVLSFGDPRGAEVATLGLNPSYREYAERARAGASLILLRGVTRRFETLASLRAASRADLTTMQCEMAIATMYSYFQPGRPAYWQWFQHLENVLRGLGVSYIDGTATHLDFVQEATYPTWAQLATEHPDEAADLWSRDVGFLRWQLENYPVRLVLCNGRTVSDALLNEVRGRVLMSQDGTTFRWWVGRGDINGRVLTLGGWNYPLDRPTGLGTTGETRLGGLLRSVLRGRDGFPP